MSEEELDKMPIWIPENRRNACPGVDCNYVTVDTVMLVSHMDHLHPEFNNQYKCPHCSPELGMISHKKSLKTIFGHKCKINNFIKNLIFFILKNSTAIDFDLHCYINARIIFWYLKIIIGNLVPKNPESGKIRTKYFSGFFGKGFFM